jgi:hypothetical protein
VLRRVVYVLIALALVLAVIVTATVGWRPLVGPRARELTSRTFEVTQTAIPTWTPVAASPPKRK